MRLRRLDLVRYGKFTDHSIDFGSRSDNGPDLHIVFGLNEAGKSTALNAYLDLLYGIEERSRYAFLHEYAAMRVGGILELDGTHRELARVKQRANSLLDADGQPVGDLMLGPHLAGLTRSDYATMFSLDDETLEAGGRAILESQGDLGQLLFAAGAGLSHASKLLEDLQAESDRLHRKHAQSTELATLKRQLVELKADRDAIDTLASTYETLEAERADATDRYDRMLLQRSALSNRLDTIARHCRAIPLLAELERKKAKLADLPTNPLPRFAWEASVADMIRDDAAVATRLGANEDEAKRLEQKLAERSVDAAALSMSERIRGLSEWRARHLASGLDLPRRRMEMQIIDDAAAATVRLLGAPGDQEPAELLLPAATVGAVRALLEQCSGIATAVRAAHDEERLAVAALQSARERVGEDRAVPAPARARLAAALAKCRDSGHSRRLQESQDGLDESKAHWSVAQARLHPWPGHASLLSELVLPGPAQLRSWEKSVAEDRTRIAVLAQRIADLEGVRQAAGRSLAALRRSVDAPEDETASTIRASRDQAWLRHREALSEDTADAFADALAEDDVAGAKRLANAGDLQELRNGAAKLEETDDDLVKARTELDGIDGRLAAMAATIRLAAGDIASARAWSVSPELALETMDELLTARALALEAWQQLQHSQQRLERVVEEGSLLLAELKAAAKRVGIGFEQSDGLEASMAVAELFLERQAQLDARVAESRKTVAAREDDVASRTRMVETAEKREEEWLSELRRVLAGTWLENGHSPSGLSNVLDQLGGLAKRLQDRDALRVSIEQQEADREAFLAEVAAVALEVGEDATVEEPEQIAARLAERLDDAERWKDARASLLEELERLNDLREGLTAELRAHEERKHEVLRAFGADTLGAVADREAALKERDRIVVGIGELEDRIAAELNVVDVGAARNLLEGVDIVALAIERDEIPQRLADADEALREQLIRQTRAADRLEAIGSDSAVARIDARRRTILLEIENKASQYLRLKLGTMAAANALREYRDRHRSGMMRRASDAFAMMTRGSYSGLSSQPVKDGEVLIAMQRDGRSKVADALSKGTRFQLYLALRLAGYEEFAGLRPTVPFIADDIMETFDHVRSEEVFRLFGQMGKFGQVIYLTHHRHLCDMAQAVVPGARIHEIG